MENKYFDIGAKVSIVDRNLVKIEDFHFVIIDDDFTYAELLTEDKDGDLMPIFGSGNEYPYYIIPGFYEHFVKKGLNHEHTFMEIINYLKGLHKGQLYDYDNKKYINSIEEFDEDYDKEAEYDVVKLCEEVKEKIINQDELVKKVVTAIVYNQRLVESDLDIDDIRLLKKVLLVLGKTGTGKTEVMKQVSKNLGIPYVIEDATKFTMEGYVGRSTSDMLIDLYKAADYDLEAAQTGLLIIDEIDKKSKGQETGTVSSTGVQTSLLKMLEGETVTLTIDKGPAKEEIQFDTSMLTIFLMGAFSGIEKKVSRTIGFNNNEKQENQVYSNDDLTAYGMIPELVGRISAVVKTKDLELEDFKDIITKSTISPLKLQEKFYKSLGIELNFDDEFIEKLAKTAKEKNIGARGIKLAFDEIFGEYEFEALNKDFEELNFEKGKVLKRIKQEENK